MNDSIKEKKPSPVQSNKPAPQKNPQGNNTDQRRAKSSEAGALNAQSSGSQPPTEQQHQAPQPSGMFDAATIKAQWKQMLDSARKAWSKLTNAELIKTGGDEQKLTGLVKERYAIPRGEANKQVKSFFTKNSDK